MLKKNNSGTTLIELMISLTILAIVALSMFALFTTLVNSTIVAKRRAVASTLATNQMEYLKSLPYDNLAIDGGSIYSSDPLPAEVTHKINGVTYKVVSSINYVDDAYDGCASYPTQQLKEQYCRNYPSPTGAPDPDTNPQDYKIVHVSVLDSKDTTLAETDTQIAARVSETASTTGAMFITVIDSNGNPVPSANVVISNTSLNPDVNVSDSTDSNGVAVLYGLPPDTTNFDYNITASKNGYSSLTTIPPSGSLQPTYPNQKILTQQSSHITLTIKPLYEHSILIETTNTGGSAISGVKIFTKGGYKKYTDTADTNYYFNNQTPSDNRPTTDSSGLAALDNLVPGNYIFCGENGASGCNAGGTNYYLTAAVPYGGTNSFNPIIVPVNDSTTQSDPKYSFNGADYAQKVRLILSTNSAFPRISKITPYQVSLADDNLSNYLFTISGFNLPCDSNPASCTTEVKFTQNSNTFTASCTGSGVGTDLSCSVDLTGAVVGSTFLDLTVNSYHLSIPTSLTLGGIIIGS